MPQLQCGVLSCRCSGNDRFVEITSGLEAGAVVMTEGHFTLAHGAAVQVQARAARKK
jgi:hypothetical protein